jgi:hypothetical protein
MPWGQFSHMCQKTLMNYYIYFDSIMNYGFLFWGHFLDSAKIFRLQKNISRIMWGCRSGDSFIHLFMKLKIVPLPSQYIFSLLLFLIKNRNQYPVNSEIRHINTRQHSNFHQPLPSLTKCQKGTYYLDIKVYNGLPSCIKDGSDNPNTFKLLLRDFV